MISLPSILCALCSLQIARKGNWHSNQNFDWILTIPLFGASFSHFASSLMDGIINNSRRTLLISPMSNTRDVIQSAQRSYCKRCREEIGTFTMIPSLLHPSIHSFIHSSLQYLWHLKEALVALNRSIAQSLFKRPLQFYDDSPSPLMCRTNLTHPALLRPFLGLPHPLCGHQLWMVPEGKVPS